MCLNKAKHMTLQEESYHCVGIGSLMQHVHFPALDSVHWVTSWKCWGRSLCNPSWLSPEQKLIRCIYSMNYYDFFFLRKGGFGGPIDQWNGARIPSFMCVKNKGGKESDAQGWPWQLEGTRAISCQRHFLQLFCPIVSELMHGHISLHIIRVLFEVAESWCFGQFSWEKYWWWYLCPHNNLWKLLQHNIRYY